MTSKPFNINLNGKQYYWTLGFSLSVFPFLVRTEQVYHALPQLHAESYNDKLSSLSIIVPVRNEAQNLHRFLASLEEQDYPGQIEIIIVEDHSTDDSLEVVERKQRDLNSVRNAICTMMLIPAPPFLVGWLGKPNASHLDRLIIFPRQEMSVLLEKAGLMVTFVDLFAGLRCSTTMLNGQIVLISLAPVAGHDFSAFLEGKGGNGRIFAAVKNKRRTRTIGIGKFRIITTI